MSASASRLPQALANCGHRLLIFRETHVFSPAWVNEARFGYVRIHNTSINAPSVLLHAARNRPKAVFFNAAENSADSIARSPISSDNARTARAKLSKGVV